MSKTIVRALGFAVLLVQLQPFAGALLCSRLQRSTTAGCEQAAMPVGPSVAAPSASSHFPCSNLGLCTVPAPVVPATAPIAAIITEVGRRGVLGAQPFHPDNVQTPLPPPPQA